MYRDIEVLKLLPDRAGRGGTKFGYHSFQQEPINDTRQTMNVNVWQDSWRSDGKGYDDPTIGAIFPDTNAALGTVLQAMSLHGYCKFNTYNPAAGPLTEIIGHNTRNPDDNDTMSGYIWNYSSYVGTTWQINPPTVQVTWDINEIYGACPTFPAVFVNIGSRCFIATGINECQIYDSSRGADVFGNDSGTPDRYSLGTDAPTAAPTIGALTPGEPGGVGSLSTGWLRKTSKYITDNVPNGGLSTAAPAGADTHVLTADGITWDILPGPGTNTIDIADGTSTFPTTNLTVSIANGSNMAYFAGTGTVPSDNGWAMLTMTVNGKEFIMEAFGNSGPAETPPLLYANQCRLDHPLEGRRLNTGPKNPDSPPVDPAWDPEDDIIDQPFTVTGYRWTMKRGGADVVWTGGISSANTVLGSLLTTGGNFIWTDTAPSYAYAWYDPITGHISNISPVFTPTVTNQTNVGVSINVDVGSISYPPMTTLPMRRYFTNGVPSPTPATVGRWTHILFFRTLMSGGSTLYPIGSLQPWIPDPAVPGSVRQNPQWMGLPNQNQYLYYFPPTTTGNFWSDPSTDADLLISGALRAPQFTNGKPKYTNEGETITLYPAHMAYWDGRLWTACTQDPAAIHYSCDRVQCPFGVPEESFPDTNVLRIPAADGAIRGMKLIGENLLITTERWAYTIAGNNEANYRLIRVSTRMAGVGDYQMDEFVPDVEGQTALVVFLGTDSKVYAMPLGGQATCISKEIQTFLSSVDLSERQNYYRCRVHCMSVDGKRMALVYTPGPYVAGTTSHHGKTFIYDFDQKVWTEHTLATDDSDAGNEPPGQGRHTAWAGVNTELRHDAEIYAAPTVDSTPPVLTYPQIKVRRWFGQTVPSGNYGSVPMKPGYIETFPLNFDGKKTRKRLHFIRLYVNDESPTTGTGGSTLYGWRISLRKDSASALPSVSPVQEIDSAYRQMISGSVPVDESTDAELIATDAMLSPDTPIIGYTFDVKVTFPEHTDKLFRLYRIDVGWSTASETQVDL